MQGKHRTILTYFEDKPQLENDPQLEVGEVTCVPRVDDHVYWRELWWRVVRVSWTPDKTLPTTWVAVSLARLT